MLNVESSLTSPREPTICSTGVRNVAMPPNQGSVSWKWMWEWGWKKEVASAEIRTKQSPKVKGTFNSSKSNLNQGSIDFHLERWWTDREKGFQEVSVQLSPSTSQRGASLRSTTSSRLKTARLAVIAVEDIGSSIFVPTMTNILHFLTGLANTHLMSYDVIGTLPPLKYTSGLTGIWSALSKGWVAPPQKITVTMAIREVVVKNTWGTMGHVAGMVFNNHATTNIFMNDCSSTKNWMDGYVHKTLQELP